MVTRLDLALSILNGVVGQHLARTRNPLATETGFFLHDAALGLTREALRAAYPQATKTVVVLIHGLMATEGHFAWADGSDYGSRLAHDHGMTPLYLRYNSGQAIADTGAQLSSLLTQLLAVYPAPIEELVLIGHSMGGLVVRAACHVASLEGAPWLALARRAFYLGTPHRGAPLERVGRVLARVLRTIDDPYTRLIAEIADLRSDGIKDLGDAALRHEDRARRSSAFPPLGLSDALHPVPLLPSITHYLIAGALSEQPYLGEALGDSLVPVSSATDGAVRPEHAQVLAGISHNALAHHPRVYEQLSAWLCA